MVSILLCIPFSMPFWSKTFWSRVEKYLCDIKNLVCLNYFFIGNVTCLIFAFDFVITCTEIAPTVIHPLNVIIGSISWSCWDLIVPVNSHFKVVWFLFHSEEWLCLWRRFGRKRDKRCLRGTIKKLFLLTIVLRTNSIVSNIPPMDSAVPNWIFQREYRWYMKQYHNWFLLNANLV